MVSVCTYLKTVTNNPPIVLLTLYILAHIGTEIYNDIHYLRE